VSTPANRRAAGTLPPVETRFAPGRSGNPSGRSKEIAEVEALARSKSKQAIEELMRIAKGRGLAAVRAAETVLAYGLGRPQHSLSITAKGAPLDGRFAGAARAMLEAAVAEAERSGDAGTDRQTVALVTGDAATRSDSAVIDVTSESVPADRGQVVANGTGECTP
jgi:hypothetical protein